MAVSPTPLWRRLSGVQVREPEPSVAFLGKELSAFEAARSLVEDLRRKNPRLAIVFAVPGVALGKQLASRFPQVRCEVFSRTPFAATAFLATLRVRACVVLGERSILPGGFSAALRARATPVAEFDSHLASATIFEMVGRDRKWDDRRDRKLGRLIGNTLQRLLQRGDRLATRFITRYATLDDLRVGLTLQDTILCLGNGPSSESPETLAYAGATVFRANHSWKGRGHFEKPDVVFTGTQASMKSLRGVVFGVYGDSTEKVLLMVRGVVALTSPLRYFVADQLVAINDDFAWGQHRPTSGAVMVATAVALRPKRIVIAGMDMFAHAAGAYAGGTTTANAYTSAHDGSKELAYLAQVLGGFTGELVVLSPALAVQVPSKPGVT